VEEAGLVLVSNFLLACIRIAGSTFAVFSRLQLAGALIGKGSVCLGRHLYAMCIDSLAFTGVFLFVEIIFLLGQALAQTVFLCLLKPFCEVLVQTKEFIAVALIVAIVSDLTNL
jgi:hypothetical protein